MGMEKFIMDGKRVTARVEAGEDLIAVAAEYGVVLPPEILAASKQLSEKEMLAFAGRQMADMNATFMRVILGMQRRCGQCAKAGAQCAACTTDASTVFALTGQMMLLTLVTDAAFAADGLAGSEREAEALKAKGGLN